MEAVSCIFCGDRGTRPYHAENGHQAVACNDCGLVFVTPRPTEGEMKRLYEGQETKVNLGLQIRNVERAVYEARRALDLIGRHVSKGRLLEIGCAAGYFLREASLRGFSPTGIDITGPFVRYATEVLGVDAREGTLASVELAPRSFDVVYHRNVLSHLAYPLDAFRQMHGLLRPGGCMVFQTGNVAELPGERWAGTNELDLPDHLYHFGEKQLRLLAERTGFEILDVQRYALLLHEPAPRAALLRLQSFFQTNGKPASTKREMAEPFVVPNEVPSRRFLQTLEVLVDGYITYDLGAVVPKEGRRATLVVIARAR
ncbi:class I SAM-dependent methyltransferase [Polyangium jinanense]|uniref:Class I SAM-dependent methyltransferase n=1 Tax=Polyangium jinanense TaxID=2829994 RepID=A0A9X3X8F4_9BACT|nr:class I SAM-dependent methyltransferase [Polyangium jinanense]MDC3962378.1 class I SAM-dependent methyltransferase [Polyangium jinanense]MDC3985869.1 class I SAM-dependent methyltransferase [Polyangium jinanense]